MRKTNQKRKEPENSGAEENKTKAKPKPKELTFPVAGFINQYHFCRISDKILAKLGWTIAGKRLAIEFDFKGEELIIRKPSK